MIKEYTIRTTKAIIKKQKKTFPLLLFLLLSLAFFLFLNLNTPPAKAAFPGWDNINTIYYNPAEDDSTNQFLQQAATELQTNLGQAGKTLTISTTTQPLVGIFLKVDSTLPELLNRNDEAFQLLSEGDGIHITGKTPLAVRHGAYTLLEKLGYRWYFKSPIWQIKPTSLISLDGLNEVQAPTFIYRRIWHPVSVDTGVFKDWKKWNRLDGAADFQVRHTYDNIVSPADPNAPPEAYCPSSTDRKQLDPENPYVIQKAIEYGKNYLAQGLSGDWDRDDKIPLMAAPISPNDGRGWCWGDKSGETQTQFITDKVYSLTNEVAKTIQQEFPGKYASVFNYSVYADVPSFTLEPNVLPVVATAYDVTSLNDFERIEGLRNRGAEIIGIYEYVEPWNWFYDLPRGETRSELDELKSYAKNDVKVYIGEGADSWGVYGPLYYAASKLFWDPSLDYNAILDDFFEKSFGPAKDIMKRYYERWFQGQSVTERTLALAFDDLNKAEQLVAGDQEILDRVRFLQYHARYMWLWQKRTQLTEAELKDFYKFECKISHMYTVFHYLVESSLRNLLKSNFGLTDQEVSNLCGYTNPFSASPPPAPPTEGEAAAWMDEALLAFAGTNPVDVDFINLENLDLTALANTSLASLSPAKWRDATILVEAKAGDTIRAQAITFSPYSTGTYKWIDPGGTVLQEVTLAPSAKSWQTMEFNTPVTGRYKLNGSGQIDVIDQPSSALPGKTGGTFYIYVPDNSRGLVAGVSSAISSIKLYNPSDELIVDGVPGEMEWGIANPTPGVWKFTFSAGNSNFTNSFYILGIPSLLWHDPQYLLVPASAAVPPPFAISSLNRLYLYQNRDFLFQVSGSNFDLNTNFSLNFTQNNTTISSFTSQPIDSTILEFNLTLNQINALPVGFYTLVLERSTDNAEATYTKQVLITKLGDIWSPSATDQSEQKRDGKINIYDASRLLSKWGSTQAADLAEADINPGPANLSQGKIDLYDANLMMANWGG